MDDFPKDIDQETEARLHPENFAEWPEFDELPLEEQESRLQFMLDSGDPEVMDEETEDRCACGGYKLPESDVCRNCI